MIETLERPKTSSMKPQTGGWNPWENIRSFWEETLVRTYCLYVRKSSEDDERQALSIESQIEAMRKVAERDKLDVVEIIRESKSAKASGAREGFNTLLDWLRQWRYNSILSWAPDRLSRNAWDLGSVVDLMDQGKLQEIRTNGQIFKNAPNEKFLLMILCSQAKLENDNRSINVIRGLKTKAELGHLPS
jgi:site-specific DNA recombinase